MIQKMVQNTKAWKSLVRKNKSIIFYVVKEIPITLVIGISFLKQFKTYSSFDFFKLISLFLNIE